ncbi:unnamed protein product [Cuscuta campestris]|uniref:Transposase (putative) gypsy type domain-containing protein n=1 Tax=Cuscuta campestris TaxID=132261 RepID=A0A484MIF7_9ASTE|nr:unnamed protein product [Cuscuta campestris]
MSSFSDRISSSEDCSFEDSNSSSSTGSSSPDSMLGQVPNSSIPDLQPVNQMPGEVFMGREEPVDDEPGPYDLENETRDAWEERLHTAGYFPLPTFYVLDIPSHVSKIALNKIRRRLPDGYTLLYEHDWPNIVEPHREDRIGFHTISLDAGIIFPLRPLLTEVCHAFRILPGQITPNAHRYLHSFLNICTHLKIDPSLRLFLFCFEVLLGGSGCEGFVFFKARTGRKFISEVPQSDRGWKEKFVFIEFPPFVTPFAGLKWNDHLLDQEYAAPASSPDLEANLEILMRGDPFTRRIFHYGSWVWRVESGGEGTSQAHEAAGHPPRATLQRLRARTTQNLTGLFFFVHAGGIGPLTADRLGLGSPSEFARLKKEKEEMALILKSQADELTRLSELAGSMRAEISHLKEENCRLMDEVSEAKREMAEKEETFPGRAASWVEGNKAEAVRVMTATPETTMESFRLLSREPEGRKMITAIGSFGFKSGQKKDRIASHRVLLRRDPNFSAASYGLAPISKEEPTPPFPLD